MPFLTGGPWEVVPLCRNNLSRKPILCEVRTVYGLATMSATKRNVVVAAFTEEQATKLTGISKRQLRYWDHQGFFAPSLAGDRSLPNSRLYSFRDLASLRVLNALRNESKVKLADLREVKEKLAHLGEDLWSKTTLYVLNRKVVFVNAETATREEVLSGQTVLGIPLQVISGDIKAAVTRLAERDASVVGRIEQHRNTLGNQRVIAGTRIPVSNIQAFSEAGYTPEQIAVEYPTLTTQDIVAAVESKAA